MDEEIKAILHTTAAKKGCLRGVATIEVQHIERKDKHKDEGKQTAEGQEEHDRDQTFVFKVKHFSQTILKEID